MIAHLSKWNLVTKQSESGRVKEPRKQREQKEKETTEENGYFQSVNPLRD
jgi:hypothetical protein